MKKNGHINNGINFSTNPNIIANVAKRNASMNDNTMPLIAHRKEKKEHDVIYRELHRDEISKRVAAARILYPERTKANDLKRYNVRRGLAFVPLNTRFDGCEGHHIDKEHVIYVPRKIHRSVRHNIWTGLGMEQINALVLKWLAESSV